MLHRYIGVYSPLHTNNLLKKSREDIPIKDMPSLFSQAISKTLMGFFMLYDSMSI